jgi:nicotinate phosphoribosyltransferase
MDGGEQTAGRSETLDEMADRCAGELQRLPQGCLRFINPHRYKVSISDGLNSLRTRLIDEALGDD